MFQIHPNFRGDGTTCLLIDNQKFEHYLSIEVMLLLLFYFRTNIYK